MTRELEKFLENLQDVTINFKNVILFFDKRDGQIFATIDGRVHSEQNMKCDMDNGIGKENVGKMIIGWEETSETEEIEAEVENLVDAGGGLFKKEKVKEKRTRSKNIEHNMDKFELLQEFESMSEVSPLNYKIKKGNLIKK